MNDERLTKYRFTPDIVELLDDFRTVEEYDTDAIATAVTICRRLCRTFVQDPAPPAEPVYDLDFAQAVAAMREGKTVERAVDDSAFRRWHIVHDGTLRALSLNGLWELYAITVQDFDARYRVVPEEDNG